METKNFKEYIYVAGTCALFALTFAGLVVGASEWKAMSHANGQLASISVSGEGEITAIPDIATVTMTIRESAKTVPEAQKLVEEKVTKALAGIASSGASKEDVKTTSYIVSPKYESSQVIYNGYVAMPQPVASPKIVGYEVAETLQVKIRQIDTTGKVIAALGEAQVTEISGPEFTVDDMDKAQAEAKAKAIVNAKAKAQATAKALGVSLGQILQFNEDNGGYYPMMMSARAEASKSMDSVTIPQGESVIKSRVTITYTLE